MSTYAFDQFRNRLMVVWESNVAAVVQDVTEIPVGSDGTRLAHQLTGLSKQLWKLYSEPPAAAGDPTESNTTAWRRGLSREAFAEVLDNIRKPNLPMDDGSITVAYDPVVESAHIVGRALHHMGEGAPTENVCADVAAEMAAIEDAERGVLSGRACQAVTMSPAVPSPVQVVAANAIFEKDPMGDTKALYALDPAAAAIAACHWLRAAARVASKVTKRPVTRIVLEADNIEALAHQTPTFVLEQLKAGRAPRDIVQTLITEAHAVATGTAPANAEDLGRSIARAAREARKLMVEPSELMPRLCVLDPQRPAIDLLEDLLTGIHGAWLLVDAEFDYKEDDESDDPEDEPDPEYWNRRREAFDAFFLPKVRAEAALTRKQLD